MTNSTHRDDCRLCGSKELDLVLPILPSAIGDDFIPAHLLNEKQDTYSLDTYLCLGCGHLQNIDIVNPDILFRNYTYKSSVSLGLVDYFKQYANEVVSQLHLPTDSLVVELGSNDGSLLKAFKEKGLRVVGVDPARNIAAAATTAGIPTVPEFFTLQVAENISTHHGKANLICANNVFAHADNIADIVKGIRHLLTDDGVFVFEVSYVPDIIDNMVFDTIYHEHVSHHAIIPLENFFNALDMTLFDAKKVKSKGGSIRGFAQPRSTGQRAKSKDLLAMIVEEERRGILQPKIYRDFFESIEKRKKATLNYVKEALAQGKKVAGFGASTTTTTLLYHFELQDKLSFIVDDNPIKQGLYSPGAHIPVLPSSALQTEKPDLVVILAWMYADVMINKSQAYLEAGGEFLRPLPEVRVVNQNGMRELK